MVGSLQCWPHHVRHGPFLFALEHHDVLDATIATGKAAGSSKQRLPHQYLPQNGASTVFPGALLSPAVDGGGVYSLLPTLCATLRPLHLHGIPFYPFVVYRLGYAHRDRADAGGRQAPAPRAGAGDAGSRRGPRAARRRDLAGGVLCGATPLRDRRLGLGRHHADGARRPDCGSACVPRRPTPTPSSPTGGQHDRPGLGPAGSTAATADTAPTTLRDRRRSAPPHLARDNRLSREQDAGSGGLIQKIARMPRSQTGGEVKRPLELVHPTRVEEPFAAYLETARGAFSRNTERALRSDVQMFTGWCREQCRPGVPPAPQRWPPSSTRWAASRPRRRCAATCQASLRCTRDSEKPTLWTARRCGSRCNGCIGDADGGRRRSKV